MGSSDIINIENRVGRFNKLTIKFIIPVATTIILIAALLTLVVTNIARDRLTSALRERAQSLLDNLAYNSELGVLTGQPKLLENLTQGTLKQTDIFYIVIIDESGTILIEQSKPGFPDIVKERNSILKSDIRNKIDLDNHLFSIPKYNLEFYEFSTQITSIKKAEASEEIEWMRLSPKSLTSKDNREPKKEHNIGIVRLGVSTARINSTVNNSIFIIIILSLSFILSITTVVGLTIFRVVIKPTTLLAHSMQRVAIGEFSTQVAIKSNDEIGQLAQSFNIMARSLNDAYNKLEANLNKLKAEIQERQRVEIAMAEQAKELSISEEALRSKTTILQSVLDSMGDGVIVADKTGKLTIFNPAAEKILGLGITDGDATQWTNHYGIFDLDTVTELPATEFPLAKALKGENSDHVELFINNNRLANGVFISVTSRTIHDADGDLQGAVSVFNDITKRKQAEEQLMAFNARLEQSNRELQDFAFVASHDLQEPLRKIQAFSDRLQSKFAETLPAQARDYLDRMQNAAKRMQTLIIDLLSFSRVTTKAQPFIPVNLQEIVKGVLSDLENQIEQTNGHIEIDPLPTIDADPLQMRQLMQNIISNGLKFHKKDEAAKLKIYHRFIKNEVSQKMVTFCEISIKDNGIGFDEKYLDRIFNLFQRLHSHSDYEGTGIGLAVCRKIAERHRGTITAKSSLGQGATFIITLPVKQPKV